MFQKEACTCRNYSAGSVSSDMVAWSLYSMYFILDKFYIILPSVDSGHLSKAH